MGELQETAMSLDSLVEEVRRLSFKLDGSGALMAFGPAMGIPDWIRRDFPSIYSAICEPAQTRNQPLLNLMINILPPGIAVPIHQDWIRPTGHQPVAPTVERWHLPIQTNALATFWHDGEPEIHLRAGMWFGPIPYWKKHTVYNRGNKDRIHLVVDLDTPEPQGAYK